MQESRNEHWSPLSWHGLPIVQQPEYRNQFSLQSTLTKVTLTQISALPEIVSPSEVLQLKSELAKCERGEQILLQCGDCAEAFADCTASVLSKKAEAMHRFRETLSLAAGKPVLLVGRIAGQYAKPRSDPYETVLTQSGQSVKVASYKGDNVNGIDIEKREANPKRLLDGYYRSAATM
jgi:3-deoxy-7-phosphoheptulonate synthase